MIIKAVAKANGVPYADTFIAIEEMQVFSPSPTAKCCVMRVLFSINWLKSCMLKGTVYSGSVKAGHQFWAEFADWAKKKNLWFVPKKAPVKVGNLKHGIEKSNKLFEK
jgi:hypothetical protein